MVTCISHSPAETEELGETWGRDAAPGWVIGLTGDLGAGKTQLVRGLARGLGIAQRVHSPTFALVNDYAGGRLPLAHLDLYRLETPDQIFSAGLEEYLQPEGVAVIEWVERWFGPWAPSAKSKSATEHRIGQLKFPRNFRWARLETISDTGRQIVYEDFGA
jgi:tRNA threonylcarbamoyladenosine biosynthesis protein TsaE